MEYKIIVKNKSGTSIGEITQWKDLEFDFVLNGQGSCTFKVPVNYEGLSSLIKLRDYEIYITRNGVTVWGGEQVSAYGELSSKLQDYITITCLDWLNLFNFKYTDEEDAHEAQDAGSIAWDLIDDAQTGTNASLGITQGDIEETVDRDRTYYNDNVADMIVNLSNVIGGFDFEFTPNKVFNVYVLKGSDKTASVVMKLDTNLEGAKVLEDFTTPCNQALILGQSTDTDALARVVRNDTGLQAINKIRTIRFTDMNVNETETLNDKGDGLIYKYGQKLLSIELEQIANTSPTLAEVSTGDTISVLIQKGYYNYDLQGRIYELKVRVTPVGGEKLSYVISDI